MTGWELFTWCSVATLAVGPLVVLAFFLRDLPELWRRHRGTWLPEDDRNPKLPTGPD